MDESNQPASHARQQRTERKVKPSARFVDKRDKNTFEIIYHPQHHIIPNERTKILK
jgi:hypothetical protein